MVMWSAWCGLLAPSANLCELSQNQTQSRQYGSACPCLSTELTYSCSAILSSKTETCKGKSWLGPELMIRVVCSPENPNCYLAIWSSLNKPNNNSRTREVSDDTLPHMLSYFHSWDKNSTWHIHTLWYPNRKTWHKKQNTSLNSFLWPKSLW